MPQRRPTVLVFPGPAWQVATLSVNQPAATLELERLAANLQNRPTPQAFPFQGNHAGADLRHDTLVLPDRPADDGSNRWAPDAWSDLLGDDAVLGRFDRLARLATLVCDMPAASIDLLSADMLLRIGRSGIEGQGTSRLQPAAAPDPRFRASAPLLAPDGTPLGAFSVSDSRPRSGLAPDQAEALETLAEAATALLEKWHRAGAHRQPGQTSHARPAQWDRRFDVLVDTLPQLVWSSPPDGSSDYFGAQWCRFTGQPAQASFGAGWLDFVHPDDRTDAGAAWARAVRGEGPYAVNYRLRRHDGEHVWMLARAATIRDEHGAVARWIGTCTDIQGQVQAGEMLEIMSQELNHRIKNLFAVTQGLIAMTLRNHPELKPMAGEMQSRLRALGRAHDLVSPRLVSPHFPASVNRREASLRDMLDILLIPYASDGTPRWQVTGRDIAVGEPAATPLALFIHEIGTNSVKHGALSVAGGTIAIAIVGREAFSGPQIEICWAERGGPAAIEPERRGFGYRLAEMSIVRQLGGTLEFDWRPDGLVVTATVPVSAVTGSRQTKAAMAADPEQDASRAAKF